MERAQTGWLAPDEVREVLASYGLRVPHTRVVHSASEAVQAAETIGYPVALKFVSREILHKTDVGGVRLNVSSADEVQRAFASMHDSLAAHGIAAKMEGALVQEMVAGGVETYVGMTQAPGFGALLGFGIGGVNVELWKDVAFRVHPLTDLDAHDMLEQIRGRPLLDLHREAARTYAAATGAVRRIRGVSPRPYRPHAKPHSQHHHSDACSSSARRGGVTPSRALEGAIYPRRL